jgi:hypothetical protein
MSRELRAPLARIERAVRAVADARSIINEWDRRVREIESSDDDGSVRKES